jgi:site-specific DNA recombinase
MIVERTTDALANKAKTGQWAGGRAPYGYRLAPSENGRRTSDGLVVEPGEAVWVKEVFRRHLVGESVRSITHWMIEKAAPLPRGTRGAWTTHTTFAIIKNPVYAGVVSRVHRNAPDIFAQGMHEALVTRAEWDAAQARFVPGRRFRDRQKRSSLLPFGILRCERCGGGCCRKNTMVKGKSYAYYRCQNADREKSCDALSLRAESVDQFVLDRLAELTRDPELLDDRIREAGSQAFGEQDELSRERARIECELSKHLRDRETLLARLVDSSVSTAFIEQKISEIAAVVAPLQERVAEIVDEYRKLDGVVIDTDFVRNALRQLEAAIRRAELPPDELALLVRAVVERVEIDPERPTKLYLWGRKQAVENVTPFARKVASGRPIVRPATRRSRPRRFGDRASRRP